MFRCFYLVLLNFYYCCFTCLLPPLALLLTTSTTPYLIVEFPEFTQCCVDDGKLTFRSILKRNYFVFLVVLFHSLSLLVLFADGVLI